MLNDRDYTLILDKSGSMGTNDMQGGRTRWSQAQEGTMACARKIHELDPDGITVYAFASSFKRYDNVTPDKVQQVFTENEPNGGTNLHLVLQDALTGPQGYFTRKAQGQTKANGELIIVVTDGEPNDQAAVKKVIIEATQKMDRDEELSILFQQIGSDTGARAYLQTLDDNLVSQGAKFDIVDTNTQEESEQYTFAELLTKAITD